MIINYLWKKTAGMILNDTIAADLTSEMIHWDNFLIFWENLNILKWLCKSFKWKIDLIYIDPPFATNNKFTINDSKCSTISNSKNDTLAYSDTLLWDDFFEFIRERLIFLRELLSENGSIYLHIDYKIWHYIKIIMDEVFWIENFRNDITRIKCNPKNFSRKWFWNIKDMILFYSKWKNPIRNEQKISYSEDDKNKLFKKVDKDWRRYTTIPLHAPWETLNWLTWSMRKWVLPPKWRHWRSEPSVLDELDNRWLIEWSKNNIPRKKIFQDEMEWKKLQDIREYKDPQSPKYPTEKNLSMLEMIIKTSSNEGSYVLDCFCWGGSTIIAANSLNRKWIWIDKSFEAIKVCRQKLLELGNLPIANYKYIEQFNNTAYDLNYTKKSLDIKNFNLDFTIGNAL